ncbi:hypothetical protein [uncultured phage]|nr:hypothetical protein [uncultured phage]
MPIKSLTTRQARFPLLGKIRKGGEKKENPKKPGTLISGDDLEYFRIDSDIQGISEKFTAIYGKEPKQLDCLLPFPHTDQVFPCWMEQWSDKDLKTSGLIIRCDEERQVIYQQAGKMVATNPIPCKKLQQNPDGSYQGCKCKQVGRLQIVLPKLGELGYFEVETHSKWDIIGLTEQLLAIETSAGSLIGIPFLLERGSRELSYPLPDGTRKRKTFSLLSIRVHPSRASQVLEIIETKAFQQFTGNVEPVKTLTPASMGSVKMFNPSPSLPEDRKQAGINWAVGKGLSQSEAEQIANKATSEKELHSLLQQAIDAKQKPIDIRSEDVINSSEILSEDF